MNELSDLITEPLGVYKIDKKEMKEMIDSIERYRIRLIASLGIPNDLLNKDPEGSGRSLHE